MSAIEKYLLSEVTACCKRASVDKDVCSGGTGMKKKQAESVGSLCSSSSSAVVWLNKHARKRSGRSRPS